MLHEGNSSGALEQQRRSLETFKALAESDPSNANAARSLAISYQKLGGALAKTGKTGESLDAYEHGRSILENLASSDQAGAQVRQLLRDLLMEMSDVSARAGDLNRTNRLVRRARELDQSLSRR
jgi:tetratricopeptide (TPR) repeat protein